MTTLVSTSFPWLSLLLALPLLGALLCLAFRKQVDECKWFSLATTLLIFAVSIWMFFQGADSNGWYFYEDYGWIGAQPGSAVTASAIPSAWTASRC